MSVLPTSLLPDTAAIAPDGELSIGGCRVSDLVGRYGTPLFVYDVEHMTTRCRETVDLFGEGAVYAAKAFLCRSMARLVDDAGMRIDVASGGEMHVVLSAGVSADRVVMHGNNKSIAELGEALRARVGRIVIDSHDEIDRIERLHQTGDSIPAVSIRVTPGVEAHTHAYVSTGQDDSKFGFTVTSGAAAEAMDRAMRSPAMRVVGTHAHVGSQMFRVESHQEALKVVWEFSRSYPLDELAIGGGLGVAYVEGEQAPSIQSWGEGLNNTARELGVDRLLVVEPGRAIVAAAAITIYEVGTVKRLEGIRTYVAVDGGMSDNPRPVLYGSGYETFDPMRADSDRTDSIRLVGKHCESGDVLVRDGSVPPGMKVGDLIATPVTGAYGHSMGSNYNKVGRPPVVFVHNGSYRLVVRRETYEDLLGSDVG